MTQLDMFTPLGFQRITKEMKDRWFLYFEYADPDLVKKFLDYNKKNPKIWELFYKFSLEAKKSGRKRFSHWMIMNRIRWYEAVETTGKDFKISNDFIACYARYLVVMYPEFDGFFSLKQMKPTRVRARE